MNPLSNHTTSILLATKEPTQTSKKDDDIDPLDTYYDTVNKNFNEIVKYENNQ
jgi:hypothetical protein